jgi:hypothetical protein
MCEQASSNSEQEQMAGYCEHGNEFSGSINVRRFFSRSRIMSHGASDVEIFLTVLKITAPSPLPESGPEETLFDADFQYLVERRDTTHLSVVFFSTKVSHSSCVTCLAHAILETWNVSRLTYDLHILYATSH